MKQIETIHHKEVIKYLRALKKTNKIVTFFAPINETRTLPKDPIKKKAILLKEFAMGKVAGVSDIVIIFKNKILFLEMKQPLKKLKSGKLSNADSKQSESQIEFEKEVIKSDICFYEVAYGYASAKTIIDNYIRGEIR